MSENKSNVAFYVRILPELNPNLDYVRILRGEKNVYVRCWQDLAKGKETQLPNYLVFTTNGVFYNIGQNTIFDTISDKELFDRIIYGNNALIMSYGQTGSGKTITTSGLNGTYSDRGILPRALEKLFNLKEQHSEHYTILIKMRYLETKRNCMTDLLSDEETVYDMKTYKNIKGILVPTLSDGLKMLFKAEARKAVRPNGNYNSNLANTIVTFSALTKGQKTAVSEGTLHVVDLAGIDTIGNPSCAHKSGYEVGVGNLVKSQIEQLLLVINGNFTTSVVVKRRLCISIHYLRHALNNNSIIRVLAHVRVQREDLRICTSMLRLGCNFIGMVPRQLRRYLEPSADVQYRLLADELKTLRKDLDLTSMLSNEDMSLGLSDDRLAYIQQLAMAYLSSDQSELVLLSTTDAAVVAKVIKRIFQTAVGENQTRTARILVKPSGDNSMLNETMSYGKKRSMRATSRQSIGSKRSIISRTSSRISKRKRRATVEICTESLAQLGPQLHVPEPVPTFPEAFAMFKQECDNYKEIHARQRASEADLAELTSTYNEEVGRLQELRSIVNARQNDLNCAVAIQDIEADPSTLDDICKFQAICAKHLDEADRNVVSQTEKLLQLQAEMRVGIENRATLQRKIYKLYHDYCLDKFNVLVPDLTGEEKVCDFGVSRLTLDFLSLVEYKSRDSMDTRKMSIPVSEVDSMQCNSMTEFEQLQAYMKREMARVAKRRLVNQR